MVCGQEMSQLSKLGRIQVWLRGGGEFQLVELIYILGESN